MVRFMNGNAYRVFDMPKTNGVRCKSPHTLNCSEQIPSNWLHNAMTISEMIQLEFIAAAKWSPRRSSFSLKCCRSIDSQFQFSQHITCSRSMCISLNLAQIIQIDKIYTWLQISMHIAHTQKSNAFHICIHSAMSLCVCDHECMAFRTNLETGVKNKTKPQLKFVCKVIAWIMQSVCDLSSMHPSFNFACMFRNRLIVV